MWVVAARVRRRLPSLVAIVLAAVPLGLAATPSANAATPGLNVATTDPVVLASALSTGAKYIRIFVGWNVLEPDRAGQYPVPLTANIGAAAFSAGYDAAIKQINAAGAKPIFVVLGAPGWANGDPNDHLKPPTDPKTFASFFARFVKHTAAIGEVAAYEVWNEEDAAEFWHGGTPGPDAYAPLMRAAYAAASPYKKDAKILVGPTTGSNTTFVSGLYTQGLKDSFDGIAVHTDTACSTHGPSFFVRDGMTGPINQYSFLGYRPLHDLMAANGDGDKKIWMTELGWSTASGDCERKSNAGAAGVSSADSAAFLTQAFNCLQQDPYVETGVWFTWKDTKGSIFDEIDHYGLTDLLGLAKPALQAFKAAVSGGGNAVGPCADLAPPTISLLTPAGGDAFTGSIEIKASATDQGDRGAPAVGLKQISFAVDGGAPFFRAAVTDGAVAQKVWYGASALADGPHTLTAQAFDQNGNASTTSVQICKGAACAQAASYATTIAMAKAGKPTCRGLRCAVTGTLRLPAGKANPGGRTRVEWQVQTRVVVRVAGRKQIRPQWVTAHKGGSSVSKSLSFRFAQKLSRKGRWRVRVFYEGALPARASTSVFKSFSA